MIRVVILVAVSSETQAADDKASIPHQIETCRKFIQQNNGIETAVYTLDGFSRFGYYDLTKAMEDIPPLNDCLTAAARAEFDGILLDNLDRLGSLGMMMFNYLSRLLLQALTTPNKSRRQISAQSVVVLNIAMRQKVTISNPPNYSRTRINRPRR